MRCNVYVCQSACVSDWVCVSMCMCKWMCVCYIQQWRATKSKQDARWQWQWTCSKSDKQQAARQNMNKWQTTTTTSLASTNSTMTRSKQQTLDMMTGNKQQQTYTYNIWYMHADWNTHTHTHYTCTHAHGEAHRLQYTNTCTHSNTHTMMCYKHGLWQKSHVVNTNQANMQECELKIEDPMVFIKAVTREHPLNVFWHCAKTKNVPKLRTNCWILLCNLQAISVLPKQDFVKGRMGMWANAHALSGMLSKSLIAVHFLQQWCQLVACVGQQMLHLCNRHNCTNCWRFTFPLIIYDVRHSTDIPNFDDTIQSHSSFHQWWSAFIKQAKLLCICEHVFCFAASSTCILQCLQDHTRWFRFSTIQDHQSMFIIIFWLESPSLPINHLVCPRMPKGAKCILSFLQ